jgi:hypothetical protein
MLYSSALGAVGRGGYRVAQLLLQRTVARGASLTGSDCGTMRDTLIFAAFLLLLILAVVLLARFIVS